MFLVLINLLLVSWEPILLVAGRSVLLTNSNCIGLLPCEHMHYLTITKQE